MYKIYRPPVVKASLSHRIPEPGVSRLGLAICRLFGRLYLYFFIGMARITLLGDDLLFDSFRKTLSGESRSIFAFRHPNGGEPQILTWFFLFRLKRYAGKKNIRFARPPHALFVYGYEVINWGGWPARFIMPKLGAMPVHHATIDRQGMNRIIKAIVDGPYPLALAPEGQVSYTFDSVPRLEPGAVRLGFLAAEQLENNGSGRPVEILPLSVHLRYGRRGEAAMGKLLGKIEEASGLSGGNREELSFTERLRQCRNCILEVNEARYNIKPDGSVPFEERLGLVINAALETGERMAGLKSEGELIPRMYRLRQYCWDRIFIPGEESLDDMPQIERSVKDLRAGEGWYAARHQEIVDFCWYFRGPIPPEEALLHNRIEYVQNLWDFANRTMGGAFADRKIIYPRRVIIHAAPAINLSEKLPSFRTDKKAAVSETLEELEKAYLKSIEEANRLL